MKLMRLFLVPFLLAAPLLAQNTYTPITGKQRAEWAIKQSFNYRGLAFAGPFTSAWRTMLNSPKEWDRGWEGFGKRYGDRLASVTMSNSVEAGLGAIWGEDPRYRPVHADAPKERLRNVAKQTFLATYSDGQQHFAYARLAGVTSASFMRNSYIPDSQNGASDAFASIGFSYLGRFASNLAREFTPEIRRFVLRKKN